MLSAHNLLLQRFFSLLKFKQPNVTRKIVDILLVIIPASLATILLVFVIIDLAIQQDIQNLGVKRNPIANFSPAAYPLFSREQTSLFPTISAQSAIIMDKDSHVILYQKNSDFRFSPASTTKIMTAYTALQYFHLSDVLTVKRVIDSQGSGINIVPGEQLTFGSLLKAALIYSANDAAITIADNYPGGESAFVSVMNKNARKLHLVNTHFGDPAGLNDDADYTTVIDLVRLASIAMQNPTFAGIVATKNAQITSIDGANTYTFTNRNILLGIDGVTGIKTGYTDEAGEVLATSVVKNGHTFYIIVMKSDDRFGDTRKLLPLLDDVRYVSFAPQ